MSGHQFPLIQSLPVPKGEREFEDRRQFILDKFASKVPEEYYIPQKYIEKPPLDVTHIPRECGILTARELEITENYDAFGLANAIAIRKYSSVEVAEAFSKRAIICHQISCCLTQWFPEIARERARQLDEHLARTGKVVGPFHGVPISIKQHIPVANTESDGGFLSTIIHDESDSLLVSILRDLGAVFYVKTSQPQAIMHLESDSYFGRVLNPYNIHLSAGGSSGGESALVALRGSVLGVGSDIGGSIRCPAGYVGIYGFKPTTYTLPMRGFLKHALPSMLNILACTGPLCRSLRDADWFMSEILGRKPYLQDPCVIPIPWTGLRTDIGVDSQRPLKIGLMEDDQVIQPQPPVTRALSWARSQLQALSFVEIKPYKPLRVADAMSMILRMYWPDGGEGAKKAAAASGEPLHYLTKAILNDFEGKQQDVLDVTADRGRRDAFRRAFAEDWTSQDVDVVLCPVYVGPAAAHNSSLHFWNYTAIWNFVDYPGIVFPTPIKAGKKGSEKFHHTRSPTAEDSVVQKQWETTDYEGAPIALQLVARKHHDNYLFGALERLREPLGLP